MSESDQKLDDLPIENIKRICACLSAPEMVRVCLRLPGWDYVLNLPYNKKKLADYAQGFQWLDKRLCELVAEESCTPFFADLTQAIFHYLTEESRDVTWPTANSDYRIQVLVYCDYIALLQNEPSPTLAVKHLRRLHTLIYSKHWFLPSHHVVLHDGVMICVTFGMPPNLLQFEQLVGRLGPYNILLVLLLKLPNEKNRNSNLQHLISFVKYYHNILRRVECIDWRIWCVDFTDDEDRNGSEAVEWALGTAYDRLDHALTSENR
ncbi:hypothetical protein Aperf_G00000052552 [Anoplocephala perfoliata]